MSKKIEEQIYDAGQRIGLTFDEREAMRARLLSSIAHSERDVLSPYSPLYYWRFVSLYVKPQYVSIALLVILVAGGVSAAAEKALPGEPLYQVKTSVNENVLSLFAFTPQSKAQLHTELAVRRLEEVEKLAISGKLDASTTAQAEVKIDGNLAVIKDSVKQLENDNNSVAAADTSSKAESSLKVHEAILDTLADGNTSVQDVATKVGIQATALSLDRAGMDSRNGSTTLSIDVLLNQQKVAQAAIAEVQAAIASSTATSTVTIELPTSSATSTQATTTVTSDAVNQAQEKLKYASDLLAQGAQKLDVQNYGEALVLFKKSEKIALEAGLIIKVGDSTLTVPGSGEVSTSTATSSPKSDDSLDVI